MEPGGLGDRPGHARSGLGRDSQPRSLPRRYRALRQERARPSLSASLGGGYGEAWLGAFDYALPAFESSSEAREVKASLAFTGPSARRYLAASIGESAEPTAPGGGLRLDSRRPEAGPSPSRSRGLSIEPYYSRSWKDKRKAPPAGIVADSLSALGDLVKLPILYRGTALLGARRLPHRGGFRLAVVALGGGPSRGQLRAGDGPEPQPASMVRAGTTSPCPPPWPYRTRASSSGTPIS